jgi:hypothetical protein
LGFDEPAGFLFADGFFFGAGFFFGLVEGSDLDFVARPAADADETVEARGGFFVRAGALRERPARVFAAAAPDSGRRVMTRALLRLARSLSSTATISGTSDGDSATSTPAARNAVIFSLAVPDPPAMIAPACPMRLPGGAVRPAMNATTGLVI